jgi:hypothetical protein
MQPIDERKEYNLTSSQNEKVKNDIETLIRSLIIYKIENLSFIEMILL